MGDQKPDISVSNQPILCSTGYVGITYEKICPYFVPRQSAEGQIEEGQAARLGDSCHLPGEKQRCPAWNASWRGTTPGTERLPTRNAS